MAAKSMGSEGISQCLSLKEYCTTEVCYNIHTHECLIMYRVVKYDWSVGD